MIDKILQWDTELFLFLNSLHTDWLDWVMFYSTQTETWIPLYLLLIFFILREYEKKGWLPLLGLSLVILLADRISSGFTKPFFQRLRPSHELDLSGLVHIVNQYQGGLYGFVSSHAANTFGVAMFIYLLFKDKINIISWIFAWATVVSYSRIYLGVHYPLDVFVGAILGILCAKISFWLYEKLVLKIYSSN